MHKTTITKVDHDRWAKAQAFELSFAQNSVDRGDDGNKWWRKQFNNYKALKGRTFPEVLEVGCGPHTNVRFILPLIKFSHLELEDPLINTYIELQIQKKIAHLKLLSHPVEIVRLKQKFKSTCLSEPLEELSLPDDSIDLCVCINVLDHVRDASMCLKNIERVTKKGGMVIIGQDLSNEEDQVRCPESWSDAGHPIKLDESFMDEHLGYLNPVLQKILPREEGRNPRCHYGTYILIGQK